MFLLVAAVCNGFTAMRTIKVKAFHNLIRSLPPVALTVSSVFSSVVTEMARIFWVWPMMLSEMPLKAFLLPNSLSQVSQENISPLVIYLNVILKIILLFKSGFAFGDVHMRSGTFQNLWQWLRMCLSLATILMWLWFLWQNHYLLSCWASWNCMSCNRS